MPRAKKVVRDTGIDPDGPLVNYGAAGEDRPIAWGPFGDHTLCAVMNDLRVCARLAWPQTDRALVVTSEIALPRFTWGQVVAGSNPVSPTGVIAVQRRFRRNPGPPFLRQRHAVRQPDFGILGLLHWNAACVARQLATAGWRVL
jgi:hypothetical protein